MISRGEIDMGVIAGHKVPEDLACQHFLREEIVACVPAGHPLAGRGSISFSEFLQEPLIIFKQGYYMRELMDERVEASGRQPQVVFETNLFSLVRSLIKERLGLSTFLRMVVTGDPELAAVSFDPPLHLDLVIAWKANRYLSRANRAFIDFLLEKTTMSTAARR
jgi:DNA-binding transcriptional LysR family regulator